jgi:hypothetical protein
MAALNEALKLLTDTQSFYRQATPGTRRLLNQVFFEKLILIDEWVAKAELKPWLKAMNDVALAASRPVTSSAGKSRAGGSQKNPDPFFGGRGSNNAHLVRPSGLEPPRGKLPTRPST